MGVVQSTGEQSDEKLVQKKSCETVKFGLKHHVNLSI